MRAIKFRAWLKPNKTMYQVGQVTIEKGTWTYEPDNKENIGVCVPCQPSFILMQYTGLHDKNGKEIYEGDIVKIDNDVASMFNIKSTGKVEYNNGLFLVRNGDEIGILSSLFVLADTKYCLRGEVIGNIYENPELLKGADNIE